jgi:peptidoglycan hydrolase-like protein with peptidoglycan-binding domain
MVQARLQQRGFYNSAVDGTYGPRTQQAILDFQAAEGLPMTGEIDQETLNALEFD